MSKSFDSFSDEESSIGFSDSSASSISNCKTLLPFPEPAIYGPIAPDSCSSDTKHAEQLCVVRCSVEAPSHSPSALPGKASSKIYRNLRWIVLKPYIRLWLLAIFGNAAVIVFALSTGQSRESLLTYSTLATATSVNITFSVLLRQEHFINLLFIATCTFPLSAPLPLRRFLAKVYTYGGFHSGCALAATGWFTVFTGLVLYHVQNQPRVDAAMATVAIIILCLLLAMIISSYPRLRIKFHDSFELIHRFFGWSVVALFWVQTFLVIRYESIQTNTSLSMSVMRTPSFWCLIIITLSIILPWIRLRPMTVRPEVLSNHAIRLHFDGARSKFGQGFRLSDRPLIENHAFAAIPSSNGANSFSVIVSNAGDWTNQIIRNPPTRLWTRGVLQYGAIRVATLFKSVVVVATGSGIAPCLSLFAGAPGLPCRVLWSAPKPLATYGQSMLDMVREKDAEAVIIDTKKSGRPDLVREAFWMYTRAKAEAVVIISNANVTRKVVYGLEARGVPAFAPVFDS